MVRVNKKYLEHGIEKAAWSIFLKENKRAESEKDLKNRIKKFLTSDEITLIEKRLGIQYLLGEGSSYREIGRLLDVSANTVSFVKRGLIRAKRKPRVYSAGPRIRRKNKTRPILPPRGKGRWQGLNLL